MSRRQPQGIRLAQAIVKVCSLAKSVVPASHERTCATTFEASRQHASIVRRLRAVLRKGISGRPVTVSLADDALVAVCGADDVVAGAGGV